MNEDVFLYFLLKMEGGVFQCHGRSFMGLNKTLEKKKRLAKGMDASQGTTLWFAFPKIEPSVARFFLPKKQTHT